MPTMRTTIAISSEETKNAILAYMKKEKMPIPEGVEASSLKLASLREDPSRGGYNLVNPDDTYGYILEVDT